MIWINMIVGYHALHNAANAYANTVDTISTFVEPNPPTNIVNYISTFVEPNQPTK